MPTITETQLLDVLKNDARFRAIVTCVDFLIELAARFPEHADAIIEKVLANDAHFNDIVFHPINLILLDIQFPKHADVIIQKALANDARFNAIFNHSVYLINLAEQFPRHADAMIQKVLANDARFNAIVNHSVYLINLAEQFPRHADAMIQKVLACPKRFDCIFPDTQNGKTSLQSVQQFLKAQNINLPLIKYATSVSELRELNKAMMLKKKKEAQIVTYQAIARGKVETKKAPPDTRFSGLFHAMNASSQVQMSRGGIAYLTQPKKLATEAGEALINKILNTPELLNILATTKAEYDIGIGALREYQQCLEEKLEKLLEPSVDDNITPKEQTEKKAAFTQQQETLQSSIAHFIGYQEDLHTMQDKKFPPVTPDEIHRIRSK